MTDKELKKLGRTDLLEMLIERNNEIDSLNDHIRILESQLSALNKQLSDRRINIDNSGSIAEAALKINGIFESAENAAAQYLENIKSLSGRQEAICAAQKAQTAADCERMISEAKDKSHTLLVDAAKRSTELEKITKEKCENLERETKEKCDSMTKQAAIEADESWKQAREQMRKFLEGYQSTQDLVNQIMNGDGVNG